MPPTTRSEIQKHKEHIFAGKKYEKYTTEEYTKMGAAELAYAEVHQKYLSGEKRDKEFKDTITQTMRLVDASLKLTESEKALFARRYTESEAKLPAMKKLGTVLDKRIPKRHVYPLQDAGSPKMGYHDKKKAKSKKESNEKQDYKDKKEAAHKAFYTEDDLDNEYMQKNVLAKKTEVPISASKSEKITQKQLLLRVMDGDYSNLQQLDPVLRSIAARNYMEQISLKGKTIQSADDIVNALFKAGGVSQMMNPLFRIGVSILMNGGTLQKGSLKNFNAETWRKVEDLCNQRIMSATIYAGPQIEQTKENKDMIMANVNAQIFIAKTLLACHLGRLTQKDTLKDDKGKVKDVKRKDWEGGVATAFAHCSRVAFTLPGDKATMEKMTGADGGLKAGFKTRTAATHKISRKKKGSADSELVEKKSIGHFFGQRGMNVAIGGLGNEGVAGRNGEIRKLKNDGSCGHVYMHVDESSRSKHTGLLVGFESDAPGVINMTGHKHGLGNPEFASSFGGMRTDEIGDKYGGRIVDLSGMKKKTFETAMDMLEQKMSHLISVAYGGGAQAEEAQTELMYIGDMLSGSLMKWEDIEKVVGGKLDV